MCAQICQATGNSEHGIIPVPVRVSALLSSRSPLTVPLKITEFVVNAFQGHTRRRVAIIGIKLLEIVQPFRANFSSFVQSEFFRVRIGTSLFHIAPSLVSSRVCLAVFRAPFDYLFNVITAARLGVSAQKRFDAEFPNSSAIAFPKNVSAGLSSSAISAWWSIRQNKNLPKLLTDYILFPHNNPFHCCEATGAPATTGRLLRL